MAKASTSGPTNTPIGPKAETPPSTSRKTVSAPIWARPETSSGRNTGGEPMLEAHRIGSGSE
jgi:hypothetical protein